MSLLRRGDGKYYDKETGRSVLNRELPGRDGNSMTRKFNQEV
jgi:hypothetical protein